MYNKDQLKVLSEKRLDNDQIKIIEEHAARMEELHKKQAELMKQLIYSFKIKSIWPDAFMDGCTVSFYGRENYDSKQKKRLYANAWLKRSDGEKYILSKDELEKLKPGTAHTFYHE